MPMDETSTTELSPRTVDVLCHLVEYMKAHNGEVPSYDKLKDLTGYKDKSSIHARMRELQEAGLVQRLGPHTEVKGGQEVIEDTRAMTFSNTHLGIVVTGGIKWTIAPNSEVALILAARKPTENCGGN